MSFRPSNLAQHHLGKLASFQPSRKGFLLWGEKKETLAEMDSKWWRPRLTRGLSLVNPWGSEPPPHSPEFQTCGLRRAPGKEGMKPGLVLPSGPQMHQMLDTFLFWICWNMYSISFRKPVYTTRPVQCIWRYMAIIWRQDRCIQNIFKKKCR